MGFSGLAYTESARIISIGQLGEKFQYANEAPSRLPRTALMVGDESLKKDPEVVKLVLQKNGLALEYADESFKKDPEIVKLAVQENRMALEYADESVRKDPEIVKLAVQDADESKVPTFADKLAERWTLAQDKIDPDKRERLRKTMERKFGVKL